MTPIQLNYDILDEMNLPSKEEAEKRVDEVVRGCASTPGIPEQTCDYVFIRFLNSEVVNRKFSLTYLMRILRTVKLHGHAIIFGHTFILLSRAFIKNIPGFTLQSSLVLVLLLSCSFA